MIASYPHRRFQLWEYNVSHGALLVRSPRGPEADQNVDLVFAGVEYVAAPRMLSGVELDHGDDTDVERAAAVLPAPRADRVFVIISEGRRHLVIAAAVKVVEHQGEIFDPTPQ